MNPNEKVHGTLSNSCPLTFKLLVVTREKLDHKRIKISPVVCWHYRKSGKKKNLSGRSEYLYKTALQSVKLTTLSANIPATGLGKLEGLDKHLITF